MKIITIGRGAANDIVINDPQASRAHCQIIYGEGVYTIVDLNSTNGTYVNGVRRTGSTRLNPNDIVRIGNSTLPWMSYFANQNTVAPGVNPQPAPQPAPQPVQNWSGSSSNDDESDTGGTVLAFLALLLSFGGVGCAVYYAIKAIEVVKDAAAWGPLKGDIIDGVMDFYDYSTIGYIGIGLSIGAVVLASIADAVSKKDNTIASIAKVIGGIGLMAAGGALLYCSLQ